MKININPPVFFPSVALIGALLVAGAVAPDTFDQVFPTVQGTIVDYFGWLYIVSVAAFLGFAIYLMFSRFGAVRLGSDDDEPEFSNLSWFAMLFSAGMGIGLLFWSVAEPMSHVNSDHFAQAGSVAAARHAINTTYFHWGLHAWAIYIVMALPLAYVTYRLGRPLAIRSCLYPLLGDRVEGPLGNVVDIVAVVATLFGLATSLGFGVQQVNAGLNTVFGLTVSTTVQVTLIAVITGIATISVVSGLDKGIKFLSTTNFVLGIILVLFVLFAGPTVKLVTGFVQSLGFYGQRVVEMTFRTDAYAADNSWQASWTMFYWGWWIAWSPFVGTFIARVSRGRTIREFVTGALLAPTGFTFAWLFIFGQSALLQELGGDTTVSAAMEEGTEFALFALLDGLPLTTISSILATVVIITYFVTSSDSGSLVIDMLTSKSDGVEEPPVAQKIFWAVMEGAAAAVLLIAGGLGALQRMSVAAGLPFCIILLVICYSLMRALQREDLAPAQSRELRERDERSTQWKQRKVRPPSQ